MATAFSHVVLTDECGDQYGLRDLSAAPKLCNGQLIEPATVCSSFVWSVLHSVGATLEGSEVEPEDVGAIIDESTADGLYVYTENRRRNAAFFMWNQTHAQVMGGG